VLVAGTGGFAGHWAQLLDLPRRTTPPSRPSARSGLIAIGSRHPISRTQALGIDSAQWPVFTTPIRTCGNPVEVSRYFAEVVKSSLTRRTYEALIIFGGDTTAAILHALGCRVASPVGELVPGVPASRIEALGRTFLLVTKAGGFGDEHTLARIVRMLEESV
jgi:hypothetical protein